MISFHELPLQERLSLVRRGTAYYSGQLATLKNTQFHEPTLLSEWDIAHLSAHVAYNAAALCNLMEWASTGKEKPMYDSPEARGEEIEFGATLPPGAIRNLHDHTLVRLDVAWRDAPDYAWEAEVKTAQGRTVPASETLWMRSREVWIHAIDLNQSGRFTDIPRVILSTLLPEIVAKWNASATDRSFVVANTENNDELVVGSAEPSFEVRGNTAGLVRWATGRGSQGVTASTGTVPEPPRWL